MCFSSGKKAARIAADATLQSAEMQAQADRYNAQAAEYAMETSIAQDRAAKQAAEMLTKPQEQVEVYLGPEQSAEIDPDTQRRKTARSKFNITRSSGVAI